MTRSTDANTQKPNVELLTDKNQTIKSLTTKLNELITAINTMPAPRDRGPKSERDMTESDARQILIGDMKDLSHKVAAQKLNLSYGQIYSARNGYTFKGVYDEYVKASKK